MMTIRFSFEDLEVWKKSVEFCEKVLDVTDQVNTGRNHYRIFEQLESASASVAQNIAEGKGRFSKKEFIQFLYISKGSLNEALTLLIIFHRKGWINDSQLTEMRQLADQIGRMISGLTTSIRRSIPNT